MQEKSLETAHKYEREATEHLRRVAIISAGLEVMPTKKDGAVGSGEWYEDPRQLAMLESMETGGADLQEV